MADFDGFIGAKVLTPGVWNVINTKNPAPGFIFTASATMTYSPGFKIRDLNQANATTYDENEDGLFMPTAGPDDDCVLYLAVVPKNTNLKTLEDVQPYLNTTRYSLAAAVTRIVNGLILPAGFDIIAYSSKPDLSINVFGVEGRAAAYKSTTI